MEKEGVEHVYSGILLGREKEWTGAIGSDTDGSSDGHRE